MREEPKCGRSKKAKMIQRDSEKSGNAIVGKDGEETGRIGDRRVQAMSPYILMRASALAERGFRTALKGLGRL